MNPIDLTDTPSPTPPVGPADQQVKDEDRAVKKRTKTGCSTCRLRRIKCDEAKPYCYNCFKAKRQCGGYGVRSSHRDEGSGDNKRSQRFAPYGETDDGKIIFKSIIPAPPKESDIPPIASQSKASKNSNSPKRKRKKDIESPDYPYKPEHKQETKPPRRLSSCQFDDSPRISISSLLAENPASVVPIVSKSYLNAYVPNYYNSSPLIDPIMFDAFQHFVEVVAPAISLIESSPPNPTLLNHHEFPKLRASNLFTYQLPVMAMSGNWAMMEAIIAISLLHKSHITRSSKQQAFLHYQLALKRLQIESCRSSAARDLGLLAASLLLAWYELTTGDHSKWVRHMTGAKVILIESGTWREKTTRQAAAAKGDLPGGFAERDTRVTNYNNANQPLENMSVVTDQLQALTGRVLLHELFYFYAKMDVIQALVRGGPTLLDLSEWQYPLRGPASTILGLHDALIHLMARLASFISTDRERKAAQNQGHPTASIGSFTSTQSPNPSHSPSTITPTFSHCSSETPPSVTPDQISQAYRDWEVLSNDFRKWKDAFKDLRKTRIEPNMPTPFGPAIIYADIRVAATEMLYLAAQIHLSRAHPSTPVFLPAAIGATAPQNGPLVAKLMRIQEGLWDSANFLQVKEEEDGRTVGGDGRTVDYVVGALSNCAWPMMVGGVQVRDEQQRNWMKKRLCDIYEMSGFATALRVKKGLERVWGQRVKGEPTGFDDIDNDDEYEMNLLALEKMEQARELRQRRKTEPGASRNRFVLIKDEEAFGNYSESRDLTRAFGVFGPKSSSM